MSQNTSISTVQKASSSVVPKPTKTHLIEILVKETIAKRVAENEKRQKKREAIQAKLDKAIEKFKKTSIKLSELPFRWNSAGEFASIGFGQIPGSPEMQRLSKELDAIPLLTTNPDIVRDEVKRGIDKEILTAIIEQPGVKEAISSTIAKLKLA